MYTRTLIWQLKDGTQLELPYYPTQIELLIENFAKKHGIELSGAKDRGRWFCANYSRNLTRPINSINLDYDRHIWEHEKKYFDQIRGSVPLSGFSGISDLLNKKNVITHMRCLHDPSLYTEELSLLGKGIDLQFGFKGYSEYWIDEDNFFLKPKEFQLLGKYFTAKRRITQEEFSNIIEDTEPMELLETILQSVE